ncbi:MAG: hypothetical protein ACREEM_20600 [Blastocatellia bacterium]
MTLAELGGGNRPLDLVAFEKEGKTRLLIAETPTIGPMISPLKSLGYWP